MLVCVEVLKAAMSVGMAAGVQLVVLLKSLVPGTAFHVFSTLWAAMGNKATADRTVMPKYPNQRGLRGDIPKMLPRSTESLSNQNCQFQPVRHHRHLLPPYS